MVRLTGAVALVLAASANAAATFKPNVIPGAYIFELDDAEDSSGFLRTAKQYGQVRKSFDHELFKGVSMQLDEVEDSDETARQLSNSAAVRRMWPVTLHSKPDTTVHWTGNETNSFDSRVPANHTGSPYTPHVMTQVDKLQAKGYTGKGVSLAIIDTGIDYKHPTLGGCFGEGCLVAAGHDFVGDSYSGRNDPIPDDDPMDCDGHGSHLAGIIAAQNNTLGFAGASPGVTLRAYRVFGCYGSVTDDVLLEALMQAYDDGADIVSLSLGSPIGWSEHPWSAMVGRIIDAGVPCIVAAGNDGDTGAFFASSPADGKGVAAIACTENAVTPMFMSLSSYAYDNKTTDFLYRKSWQIPPQASLSLWAPGLSNAEAADGCEAFPDDTPDLSDSVLLLRTGGCTFAEKALNAAAKGSSAIITYLDGPGVPGVPEYDFTILTTVTVDAATGETWLELLKEGTEVEISFPAAGKQVNSLIELPNNLTGGAITHFSTWGPTWEMDLKPQFAAPGGSILSTYPMRKGGYAILSGTSMSTPLVAAIYALLGEVRGTLDPEYIKSLLSSTATPSLFNDNGVAHDYLAPVPQQGAGSVQAFDAAFSSTLLEPSSLSFNDTDYFAESLNFTITYEGDEETVTYNISHSPSHTVLVLDGETGNPGIFPNEMVETAASLKFSNSDVTLKKGESVTVEVLATPADVDAKRLGLWSGWVAINGTDGTSLSLPYQGLTGSLKDTTVLGPDRAWISRFDVSGYQPLPENTTFNLPPRGTEDLSQDGKNVPLLISNYVLGTRLVKAELVPISSGNEPGSPIGQHSQFPTRWNQRGRHITDWGGRLDTQEYAPPGTYQFRFKALRLRGDEENEDDWDVSLSQVFNIKYQTGNSTA